MSEYHLSDALRDENRGLRLRIQTLESELERLRKVIDAQREYTNYLAAANRMVGVYLHTHGWVYPSGFLERGEMLLKKVVRLDKEAT